MRRLKLIGDGWGGEVSEMMLPMVCCAAHDSDSRFYALQNFRAALRRSSFGKYVGAVPQKSPHLDNGLFFGHDFFRKRGIFFRLDLKHQAPAAGDLIFIDLVLDQAPA